MGDCSSTIPPLIDLILFTFSACSTADIRCNHTFHLGTAKLLKQTEPLLSFLIPRENERTTHSHHIEKSRYCTGALLPPYCSTKTSHGSTVTTYSTSSGAKQHPSLQTLLVRNEILVTQLPLSTQTKHTNTLYKWPHLPTKP